MCQTPYTVLFSSRKDRRHLFQGARTCVKTWLVIDRYRCHRPGLLAPSSQKDSSVLPRPSERTGSIQKNKRWWDMTWSFVLGNFGDQKSMVSETWDRFVWTKFEFLTKNHSSRDVFSDVVPGTNSGANLGALRSQPRNPRPGATDGNWLFTLNRLGCTKFNFGWNFNLWIGLKMNDSNVVAADLNVRCFGSMWWAS